MGLVIDGNTVQGIAKGGQSFVALSDDEKKKVADYDDLKSQVDNLKSQISSLQDSYSALQSSYSDLQTWSNQIWGENNSTVYLGGDYMYAIIGIGNDGSISVTGTNNV